MAKTLSTKVTKAALKQTSSRRTARKSRGSARSTPKSARILAMLQRAGGTTLDELMKETGWQQHSQRGYLSGTIGKRLRHLVSSEKINGERRYRIERKGTGEPA